MSLDPLPEARLRGRRLGFELVIVFVLALALLVPGLWGYSLVDPWETHYAEVARRMQQDHDWVHTDWQNEGFRSKPVLTFWMMAASMKAMGIGADGGYSGEMVSSPAVMLAVRLPFALFGALGLVAVWWMLARLVSRRVAYLAFLVIGTTPFYFFVARQGITDIPLIACIMGAVAFFVMANEVGDEPLPALGRLRGRTIDARHLFFAVIGGFVLVQATYYLYYFTADPRVQVKLGQPGVLLFAVMLLGLASLTHWRPAAVVNFFRALNPAGGALKPLSTSRQVYLLWFYALTGISILAKGPPGVGIVGLLCLLYVLIFKRWRALAAGFYELRRGIVLIILIAVPWHLAMYFKDGRRLYSELISTHYFNRAAIGVFGDRGTFDYYASQLGYGLFLWAALVPVALAAAVNRTSLATRADRLRLFVALWAISNVAFFSLVQTKFHHYILPSVPALGILIAFWLDDVLDGRQRVHGVVALLGAAIVLLLARDMMDEEKNWIEMFVFRYDRPWPSGSPWEIDTSDGFLALGLGGALAILLLGLERLRRLAVAALAAVAVVTALWAMHVYMPEAGTHWGMREAVRTYYQERQIYGVKLVYYGTRQLADDWKGNRGEWSFESFVPDHLQEGQPMTVTIVVRSVDDKTTEQQLTLQGKLSRAVPPRLTIALDPGEIDRLTPAIAKGSSVARASRAPIRVVDADRLIAWQLYWRGENFWSGDEIWGRLPEMQTALKETDNVKFLKYLNDATLAPPGRRYFVVTEAGRTGSLRGILPTPRAKDSYEILDTTSNKFSLAVFTL